MKRRIGRILLIVLLIVLAIVLVGPFLVPVPPLEGALPPQSLADPDSQFIEINGLDLHVKKMGEGERGYDCLAQSNSGIHVLHYMYINSNNDVTCV